LADELRWRLVAIALSGGLAGAMWVVFGAQATAQETWVARCLNKGGGTDEALVSAATTDGLVEACRRFAARPIVYDEQRVSCALGMSGCDCAGHVIAAMDNAPAEFGPGTSWRVCSGYSLTFQKDGNLVLYDRNGAPLWTSGTNGRSVARMAMQPDGNLVLYAPDGQPVWTTGTHGHGGAFLALQEDGNLVLYAERWRPLWTSGTEQR
jgi:hypothetical protein